ncbi:zinc-dependent metalloprotease [Gelidibacter maritimus]|uniref:Zinc-dependent metalloprotease n=1 Tax=Gelidibacter maritimus TaxID=2761487 RepID=A0A7W2M638_9FLAO|nr:zinc-dependent metalloprotease [Gelidibacter maritimus]MBA6153412.1 zinc-dependent metalloprotease [Gelidibacter maritimus]
MKHIITTCLFLIYTTGFCYPTNTSLQGNKTTVQNSDLVPFITSLIEGNQLYLEIPRRILNQPIIFVRYDNKYDHKYMQVIWSKLEDKILLKVPSITSTAGIILPIKPKLILSDNILAIFPIEKAKSEGDKYRINITSLLLEQNIPWSQGFSETAVPQISMVLDSANMDKEVVIKIRKGVLMDQAKISLPMYFSFCALGEPMKARPYDFRMGFFNEKLLDIPYGVENRRANIMRWRLEKDDEDQAISRPKNPITFVMSPDIPKKWRPYVKAGIEEWLPAFEEAGFRDALVVKEVDSLSEWQAHSINTSVIYWGDSLRLRGSEFGVFGGTVGTIVDERTGEILKGDIYMAISREEYSERYFVKSAPLDIRAQKFPFPDDLLGELYQTMVAHEAGHVFGLMDANFGKFSYPIDLISNVDWVNTMGHTPSVMNYTRSNNIAQPEDSIPPSLLIQKVGPMDHYNIRWAYTQFPAGTSPKEERAALELIIRQQDSIPWYRYDYGGHESIGPARMNEVIVTRNPVKSTEMALKNLKRVVELIPEVCNDQKDNARLERLYAKTLEVWFDQMMYVGSLIGGYDIHYKSINQTGNMYVPIPSETQDDALDFLFMNAFNLPEWLIRPEFYKKIKYSTFPDKLLEYQQRLLFELLEAKRTKRFEYLESLEGYEGALPMYLTKLQYGLFNDLESLHSSVKPRNQELQMTYIEKLISMVQQERETITAARKAFAYSDYTKGYIMEQLMILKDRIQNGLDNKKVNASLGHWHLCLEKLNTI